MKRNNVNECVKDLRKLYGLPPYDGPDNFLRSDGYFSVSIEQDYSPNTYMKACEIVDKEQKQWNRMRYRFMREKNE